MKTTSTPVFRAQRPDEDAAIGGVIDESFGDPLVAVLVEDLRRGDAWVEGLSFVAEVDETIIGHVMFTRSILDAPARLVDVLVLSPLSVLPGYQGNGIGTALAAYGLEQVKATRAEPLVFLEGHPDFYRRLGFEPAGSKGFRRPSLRIPEPAFMVHPLPSYEDWMTGTLVYAPEFWKHDCVGLRDQS